MIDIFIPVIWICVNTKCEFMSPPTHYTIESRCMSEMNKQKEHMKKLVKKAGQGEITVLEGTCVTTTIENSKNKTKL